MSKHTYYASRNAWDFVTYGTAGLELARAEERREQEWEQGEVLPSLSFLTPARRWLGTQLVTLGQRIAGAPAPAPSAIR
jgi:hypothetical protein